MRKPLVPVWRRCLDTARVAYLTLIASLVILCLVTATLSLATALLDL